MRTKHALRLVEGPTGSTRNLLQLEVGIKDGACSGPGPRSKTAAPCKTRSSDPYEGWRATEPVSGPGAWRGVAMATVAQYSIEERDLANSVSLSSPWPLPLLGLIKRAERSLLTPSSSALVCVRFSLSFFFS